MGSPNRKRAGKGGKKVRVSLRRNRGKQARNKDWTQKALQAEDHEVESIDREQIVAKGDLSRRRTITVHADDDPDLQPGTVVAMRGLYADVDDGERVLPCTIRRILRTRLIDERHPVTVGDRVRFRVQPKTTGVLREGVIEAVHDRGGVLRRRVGRRIHTIAANVDQVIIVTSIWEPRPKTHLIDRYIVAALAGGIQPVICMNKVDLDQEGIVEQLTDRFAPLGYPMLATSAETGDGIDSLGDALRGKASVIAGQSGVGKSSLLNALQPGLKLRTGEVSEQSEKGRHTTTTATLIRLDVGGYVVDTPGVRTFDLSLIPSNEIEVYFEDLAAFVATCKYPDCTHTHETECSVLDAVDRGDLHPERYDSYAKLFAEAVEGV